MVELNLIEVLDERVGLNGLSKPPHMGEKGYKRVAVCEGVNGRSHASWWSWEWLEG